ncbi:MAG: PhzF family phenazine biosynthesis protein [bacterium]|nr:PhzF family phenazine biosynthesis protein [bacterium]
MSDGLKYYFTDVFGNGKYTGNQLATFMDSGSLSTEEMQNITREINFSETTFILSHDPKDGGYDVRIFTPGGELDFAGHPTLGTAYIIRKHIIKKPVEKVVLNLKAGRVPVTFPAAGSDDQRLWMDLLKPEFGETADAGIIAKTLGLGEGDIDMRWPIQSVSAGVPHLIVPLKNLDALKRIKVSDDHYQKLCDNPWTRILVTFCPGGYTAGQDLGVRVFVGYYGIPEDPATGSGNGCLAAYLVKNRYFGSSTINVSVGQGYELGRPSLLSLKGHETEERVHMSVGGKVIPIAEGFWG